MHKGEKGEVAETFEGAGNLRRAGVVELEE